MSLRPHRIIDAFTKCLPPFAFGDYCFRQLSIDAPRTPTAFVMPFKQECSTKREVLDAGAELKLPVRWTDTMWWMASCPSEMILLDVPHNSRSTRTSLSMRLAPAGERCCCRSPWEPARSRRVAPLPMMTNPEAVSDRRRAICLCFHKAIMPEASSSRTI